VQELFAAQGFALAAQGCVAAGASAFFIAEGFPAAQGLAIFAVAGSGFFAACGLAFFVAQGFAFPAAQGFALAAQGFRVFSVTLFFGAQGAQAAKAAGPDRPRASAPATADLRVVERNVMGGSPITSGLPGGRRSAGTNVGLLAPGHRLTARNAFGA
jgi:hypothetical protein